MKFFSAALSLLVTLALGDSATASPESRTDINPALLYSQAAQVMPDRSLQDHLFTNEWRGRELDEKFSQQIAAYDNAFKLLRLAARQTVLCDWGYDYSQSPELLLPLYPRRNCSARRRAFECAGTSSRPISRIGTPPPIEYDYELEEGNTMKTSGRDRESVTLLACSALSPSKTDQVREHVERCPDCRSYLQQLSALCESHTRAAGQLPLMVASPRLYRRVAAALHDHGSDYAPSSGASALAKGDRTPDERSRGELVGEKLGRFAGPRSSELE